LQRITLDLPAGLRSSCGWMAFLGLRVKPRVGRGQHVLAGLLYRPGICRAVVVLKKTSLRGLGSFLADLTAVDAVSECHGDTLSQILRLLGQTNPVEILIELLATLVGKLPDRTLK